MSISASYNNAGVEQERMVSTQEGIDFLTNLLVDITIRIADFMKEIQVFGEKPDVTVIDVTDFTNFTNETPKMDQKTYDLFQALYIQGAIDRRLQEQLKRLDPQRFMPVDTTK